jgi:hypothetical protein
VGFAVKDLEKGTRGDDPKFAKPRVVGEDKQVGIASDKIVGVSTEGSSKNGHVFGITDHERGLCKRTYPNGIFIEGEEEIVSISIGHPVLRNRYGFSQYAIKFIPLIEARNQLKASSAPRFDKNKRISALKTDSYQC